CVQINYPNQNPYTRSVEIKHVTRQTHSHTVVSFEVSGPSGDPYYPVPSPASRTLHEAYKKLAAEETARRQVHFCGRLAEYRYLNMDEAMEGGIDLVRRLALESPPGGSMLAR